ncbi:MAG TPA: hypothetical protein VMA75_00610 [Candidatus Paceibacterota bacterium]|nr:hypothetical protein [Candidatus Paceibacterota bacterium]
MVTYRATWINVRWPSERYSISEAIVEFSPGKKCGPVFFRLAFEAEGVFLPDIKQFCQELRTKLAILGVGGFRQPYRIVDDSKGEHIWCPMDVSRIGSLDFFDPVTFLLNLTGILGAPSIGRLEREDRYTVEIFQPA